MERKIITTKDGSKTIQIVDWNEQYHSTHGAIQEAYHVFIKMGLEHVEKKQIDLLEMGFGTGLNALITFLEAGGAGKEIHYIGVEAFPVEQGEWEQLDYAAQLGNADLHDIFKQLHELPWEKATAIHDGFTLKKMQKDFLELDFDDCFDLIYFDAFGARVQPELWTEEIFTLMFAALRSGGILVTYAAKGSVRRAMQAVGFEVERLPGPPGKREMLRCQKP